MVGGDSLMTNEYWSITGPAGEGTLMTFGPDPRKRPEARAVAEEFRKSGYEPEGYTLYSYATMQVYVEAVKRAGGTELDKVVQQLHGADFETVIGKFGFNDKGDVTAPAYVVYQWHDGNFAELEP